MIPQPTELPLFLHPSIVLVRPDESHKHIHQQLISAEKSDKVHPISGIEDLIQNRLGVDGSSKRCFALMGGDNGRDVMAAIYTYWTTARNAEEEWKLLPGKVDQILREPSFILNAPPSVVTFYSISSFASGGGKNLIGELHRAFTQQADPPILTTLSPLRSLRAWIENTGREIGESVDSIIEAAAQCLIDKIDGVQRFHQGNGAYIGAIQPFANAAGTADDIEGMGVMVNYRYPRTSEALLANREDFKNQISIPAARHIRSLVNGS